MGAYARKRLSPNWSTSVIACRRDEGSQGCSWSSINCMRRIVAGARGKYEATLTPTANQYCRSVLNVRCKGYFVDVAPFLARARVSRCRTKKIPKARNAPIKIHTRTYWKACLTSILAGRSQSRRRTRHYSDRRQSAGCIRRMRSVGKKVAASATMPSSSGAAMNVRGS